MEIITRRDGARLAQVHERTLDRLHAAGEGPRRIQITRRRCAYEREEFERWLRSRAFASQAEALAAGAVIASPSRKQIATSGRDTSTKPIPQVEQSAAAEAAAPRRWQQKRPAGRK
jgi:predicted DNA-binding transcriptional regulator AlpA